MTTQALAAQIPAQARHWTQTYIPWDSWDHPYPTAPKLWFADLLQPDGRPYRDSEIETIGKLSKL